MADALTREEQVAYAALADEVYVRSSLDQQSIRENIGPNHVEIRANTLNTR